MKLKVDQEYIESKFDVPANLTKTKAEELIKQKTDFVNQKLM